MLFILVDILEVLTNTKSWPAFYRKLKSLHVTKKVADSDECSDITVYVKNHNPSWRDIARAAYCCGEEAVMQKVFKCEISMAHHALFSELHVSCNKASCL